MSNHRLQQPRRAATDRQPDRQLFDNRGVRQFELPGRRSPYGVQWREAGIRKTEFFPTKELRDDRAAGIRRDRRAGLQVRWNRQDLADLARLRAETQNAPLDAVLQAWRAYKSPGGVPDTPLVEDLVKSFVARQDARLKRGEIAAVTHKKNTKKVLAFAGQFGSCRLGELTPGAIEDWLDSLGHEAAETFETYRKVLHSLFANCERNPVAGIRPRHDKAEEVGILSVPEAEQVLRTAQRHRPEILVRLCCEMFAGLRFSSAVRLEASDLHVAEKGILLPAQKLKTGRRHYVDGLPEALWAWIAWVPEARRLEGWALTPRNYRRYKAEVLQKAKVSAPHNWARHSFATYHVAAYKNPGLTATLLCHTSQQLLWSTYRGRATQPEGEAYFSLRP